MNRGLARHARYIIGDSREGVAKLADVSVDLILTSPPFLALRSYLPDDHPNKAKEIGSEATPADYLDVLLDLTEEWARVLAPHGSIVVELGDTYAGSGSPGGPLDKSLCGIPHLYHLSLAYGRNLLRPERLTDPWRIRNVIAWCRPNPAVGALGDKFRPATSYMTVATKARDRWFDLDAVREPHKTADAITRPRARYVGAESGMPDGTKWREDTANSGGNPAGAPPLDWWQIPTEAYPGSHYATWPRKLLARPILAMCPERVCTTCGLPSRRLVEQTEEYAEARRAVNEGARKRTAVDNATRPGRGFTSALSAGNDGGDTSDPLRGERYRTVGWSDCGHDSWRRGVVLDPFAGSGTTLAVATGHGRDAIGIDIDARNADLALERIGPLFLTVEHLTT